MSTSSYRYGRVPEDLLDSDASDRACRLHALLTRYGDRQPDYDPPRTELAERLSCSLDSLDRALRELVDGGFLVVEERSENDVRLPNHYQLTEGGSRTGAARGSRTHAATNTSENGKTAGDGGRTHAARGSRTHAATIKALEHREEQKEEPLLLVEQARPVGVSREDIALVFKTWTTSTGKHRALLDDKRRAKIKAALLAHPLEDVLAAVQGWKQSPHHRGENNRRTVYNDLELLLRDAAHIEQFRDLHNDHGSSGSSNGNGQPSRPWLTPGHDPNDLSWLTSEEGSRRASA